MAMVETPVERGTFTVIDHDDGSQEVEEHVEFMKLAIMQAQMAAPNDRAFNTGVLIVSGRQPIS
ncbi:hypothetical protein EV181_005785, partial [Coemansia sp. RSA 532]